MQCIEDERDPLLSAVADLEAAARVLDLEPWIVSRLRHPEREVTVNLPLRREDGSIATFSGLRVQHHCGVGPTMGPVLIAADASLHQVRAAAMEATWQMALLDLPFGGAAGAIVCTSCSSRGFADSRLESPPFASLRMGHPQSSALISTPTPPPFASLRMGHPQPSDPISTPTSLRFASLSERELKVALREYAHGLRGINGAFSDVMMPGSDCNEQMMAWLLESRPGDPRQMAAVVGKPAVLGGLDDYYSMNAYGTACLAGELLNGLNGHRVGLQGIGTLGLARMLHQQGAVIVAVADASGGLCDPKGLDVTAIEEHARRNGVLFGFPQAEALSNADVLQAKCDLLVVAGAEREISEANAERVQAQVVVEAISGSVSRAGEDVMTRRGITVVPHMLASAGEAIAASVEWSQNTRFTGEAVDLRAAVATRLARVCRQLRGAQALREAAMRLAVGRVAEQMRVRHGGGPG